MQKILSIISFSIFIICFIQIVLAPIFFILPNNRWYIYGLLYVNKYCKRHGLKVQNHLIKHYQKIAKIFLLLSLVVFLFWITSAIFEIILLLVYKRKYFDYINFAFAPGLIILFFLILLPVMIFCIKWYISQIKWEKSNNWLPDSSYIEKTIDLESKEKFQLITFSRKYNFQVSGKVYFNNYRTKKFIYLPFEKQQQIVYMTMVMDYDITSFRNDYRKLNINMFKEVAKNFKII